MFKMWIKGKDIVLVVERTFWNFGIKIAGNEEILERI